MNQRMKSIIQEAKVRYLRKAKEVALLNMIRKKQQTEDFQNTIKRNQLERHGHLIKIPKRKYYDRIKEEGHQKHGRAATGKCCARTTLDGKKQNK